ncbi:possible exopolysaccharide production protein exoY [Aurantimonas manganoxydans SI85-9A1]|uniref:Possible exopolysaccharide production protein exoY n=1 Tax=Aurantimonas manganoxydans (strain ATCC BAA-1229 / DSM 21871 / SI85-9A1) TaxID=287752 RepID=Q1YMU3_AURMS|nr:sugar transferase [Aurantimonas manganoxydans]EAS51288.1 possible exopolysaccharide production protein exoY [Aurantimonas manganoxydans SI85-9A1]
MPSDPSHASLLTNTASFSDASASQRNVSSTEPYGGRAKRVIDFTLALVGLILLAPLFLLAAIAVKLSDQGPVLFSHERVGFRGGSFGCLKFRTMRIDAAERLAEHLRSDPEVVEEWNATRKLKNDPRITAIGTLLRRSSIDELPQLINVLRGEMSLVGPRPVVADELTKYGALVGLYLSARPGLTGLWQVSGRSDTTYDQRVRLDADYLSRFSLVADTEIILKTVPALFSQRGSY